MKAKIYLRTIIQAYFLFIAAFFTACSEIKAPVNSENAFQAETAGSSADLYVPPKPEEWTLENGLRVMFLENDELPLVSGTLFLRGGALWESPQEEGVVSALGDQMRQGGAGAFSADELDARLERLAASISSNFGAEFGKVGFACLSDHFSEVFDMFADVVLRPRFEQERLLLWKGQAIESIRRRVDDPGTLAGISLTQLLYGDSPYGRVAVEEDVKRIMPAALKRAHQKFVSPLGAILLVTGKIQREHIEKIVKEKFSAWSAPKEQLGPAPAITYTPRPGIYFIEQPLAQATVLIGELGVPRFTPDYLQIEMFNSIFGSGTFGSRLMRRIRSELGLAYGIWGGINPGVVKGKNTIQFQTKSASVSQAIVESLRVLKGMQLQVPEESELAEAKQSIRSSFIFNFDTPEKVLLRRATLILLSFPEKYDETYLPGILSLKPEDVRKVAYNRWDLSHFVVVVAGDKTAYDSLAKLVASPSLELQGMKLQKVRFDQKLLL